VLKVLDLWYSRESGAKLIYSVVCFHLSEVGALMVFRFICLNVHFQYLKFMFVCASLKKSFVTFSVRIVVHSA